MKLHKTPSLRRALGLLLCVAALLAPATVSTATDDDTMAEWRQQMAKNRELLLDRHWLIVRNQSTHLLREMLNSPPGGGSDLRELLAAVSAQRALALAGMGDGQLAIWDLHVAMNLNPAFRDEDLDAYGTPGAFLERTRSVSLGPQGARAAAVPIADKHPFAVVPRFAGGSFVRFRGSEEGTAGTNSSLSVEFVIDKQGAVRDPVVKGVIDDALPVVTSLWMLQTWHFEPGRVHHQPAKFLYEVPLPITEETVARVKAELGTLDSRPTETATAGEVDSATGEAESATGNVQGAASRDTKESILAAERTVRDWAEAWSRQDIESYLVAYSDAFEPVDGMPRERWESDRRQRLAGPEFIEVTIGTIETVAVGTDQIELSFLQRYRSDRFSDQVRKVVLLSNEDGAWRILREQAE